MPVKLRYTDEEIAEMLEKARKMGYSLAQGSELEDLTLFELDQLVNGRQC